MVSFNCELFKILTLWTTTATYNKLWRVYWPAIIAWCYRISGSPWTLLHQWRGSRYHNNMITVDTSLKLILQSLLTYMGETMAIWQCRWLMHCGSDVWKYSYRNYPNTDFYFGDLTKLPTIANLFWSTIPDQKIFLYLTDTNTQLQYICFLLGQNHV